MTVPNNILDTFTEYQKTLGYWSPETGLLIDFLCDAYDMEKRDFIAKVDRRWKKMEREKQNPFGAFAADTFNTL